MKYQVKTLPKSQMSIIVTEIPKEMLEKHEKAAWKQLTGEISVPGFRKGNVPEDMLKSMVSDERLRMQIVQNALSDIWRKTLEDHAEVHPICEPELKITSFEPLSLEWIITLFPKVTVGDYKKIKVERNTVELKPKEADEMIEKMKKQYFERTKKEETAENLAEFRKEMLGKEVSEEEFYKEIESWLLKEATNAETNKMENSYFEELIKLVEADVPQIMIEEEKENILSELKRNVMYQGGSFEEYLKHIGKTEDELKTSYEKNATERLKLRLALAEITKKEGIDISDQEMTDEIEKMMNLYEETKRDELRSKFGKDSHSYASLKNRLRMEKTLKTILPS